MKNITRTSIINKALALFLTLSILCIFAGCGDKSGKVGSLSSASMPDFQYMFKIPGAYYPTQKSDSGYYNVVSNHIIYTDAETLKSTPLCNKSDCLHKGNFPDCNAKMGDLVLCFDNFQIYKDKIYYLAMNSNSSSQEEINDLIGVSLDGSEKETVLSLKNRLVSDWFIYDGYFYYQPTVTVGEDNSYSTFENFYRVDLSSKSEEAFIDFSQLSGIYGAVGSLRNVYNGYMYVTLSGYSSDEAYNKIINGEEISGDSDAVIRIARYSLSDGSCTDINPYNNDYDFIGFSGGKLVGADFEGDAKKICISDLDGANPQTIKEVNNLCQVFCDDDYIYVCNQSIIGGSDGQNAITVYDKTGKEISVVYVPDELSEYINTMTFYDDYIWFQNYTDSGAVLLCCIEKAQLLSDGTELTYQQVYSYES